MKLVLFDIDGTLIRDDGAAREAYGIALKKVYDYERPLKAYDFSGRTDPQITYMVLGDGGFSPDQIEAKFGELWTAYLEALSRLVSRERVRVMPGILPLLDELHRHDDVVLGLLTGNIEPGARIKLAPHDLNAYFPFGAFGSDSMDREKLPPIAIHRAEELAGHRIEGRDVVIIGDSIYDVRCGVPHNATTIAVATGVTPPEKLHAENPDHFFETLEDTDGVMRAILA